jgi:5-methylcytosine-specific restriction endonuclease McrA
MQSQVVVLQLDVRGMPQRWVSLEAAVTYVALDAVAWVGGDSPLATLRGGRNARTGRRSSIDVWPIVALRGAMPQVGIDAVPAITRRRLLRRDRHTCAYCGGRFATDQLTCEHIVPVSRGGRTTWMNLVAACAACNGRKADRTPEEAGMRLRYLPYVPNRFESLLLDGRRIRADVNEWLAARLPKDSRLQ